MYKNKIAVVDLNTGQVKELRKKNEPEDTFIRGIRLSATKQYMIVLLKDQYVVVSRFFILFFFLPSPFGSSSLLTKYLPLPSTGHSKFGT